MTQRAFALTILLIIAVVSRALPWSGSLFSERRDEIVQAQPADAESMLASGQPIPLLCADMSSLELIPGISDKTALELLEKRNSIILAESHRSLEESLQLARGIGGKTAARLVRYLAVNGVCDTVEGYHPNTPTPR
jgi:hypothetical protein